MSNHNSREWRRILSTILSTGADNEQDLRPHEPRDRKTKEVLSLYSRWEMSDPLVLTPARKLSCSYAISEALWTMRGRNELEPLARKAPYLREFTDDGQTLTGAWGPPFYDQAPYVTLCLRGNPDSRQAVCTFWRPRPMMTKDYSCAVSAHWLVRRGVLHCVFTMRSSDAWVGLPYDVFTLSLLSANVAARVNANSEGRTIVRQLGDLHLTAGSQHLYGRDWEDAQRAVEDSGSSHAVVRPLTEAQLLSWRGAADVEAMLETLELKGGPREGWLSEVASW